MKCYTCYILRGLIVFPHWLIVTQIRSKPYFATLQFIRALFAQSFSHNDRPLAENCLSYVVKSN